MILSSPSWQTAFLTTSRRVPRREVVKKAVCHEGDDRIISDVGGCFLSPPAARSRPPGPPAPADRPVRGAIARGARGGGRCRPAAVPSVRPARPGGPVTPLVVASYNIHRGVGLDRRRDLDRIVAVIREISPDIVGLQEAVRGAGPPPDDQAAHLPPAPGLELVLGEA